MGDPGNAADTRVQRDGASGYGAVGYAYAMGTFDHNTNSMSAGYREQDGPYFEDSIQGFRLALVPEPASMAVLAWLSGDGLHPCYPGVAPATNASTIAKRRPPSLVEQQGPWTLGI